ncbi:MAG: T9SS type A sorting domain-containing protein [Bacteroidota bacterium]
MKKIFTYILSVFTLVATGQSVELELKPEKSCNDRSYCVDLQLKKSSLSAADATIGTSSILMTYDARVLSFKNYTSENFNENSPCSGWLPHRYDAISREGEVDITLVLADNGNSCPVVGTDAVNVGRVCFDIIQQGASPNIQFDLDHSQFNQNDSDDGVETVAIAHAASIDEKNLLVCDCSGTGEPCDDGNIYTVNDRYDVFCNCIGQYEDVDEDGILDGVDNCLDRKYEAEDAVLNEVAFRNNQPQFCGLGFIDFLHQNGDYIEFTVQVTQEGLHTLAFRYALEEGNRPLELSINGDVVEPELDFPATGAWANWEFVSLDYFLNVGTHAIRIATAGNHGPNVDQLVLSVCSGCAETGQPCDDGNACTTDDVIGLDCNCGGKYEDTDFDGICNVMDVCEGFDDTKDADGDGLPDGCDECDNALIGTPCDDGDPCTENDRYIADCECLGTFTGGDADNDGVCDDYDICPNGNDALDADEDGIPDACDTCDDRLIGTPCDDGDPCTLLDVVRTNCDCLGTFFDSDDDGTCTELDLCEGFDDSIDADGDGQPDACDDGVGISSILEIGKAFGVTDDWRVIELENTYQSMVVVTTPVLPDNEMLPVVTRIRKAQGNQFEIRLQNPSGESAGPADVQFMVGEEGVYTEEEHGVKMEIRKELSTETASKNSGYIREQHDYLQPYSNPVIVGQVMTYNDDSWSVFWSSKYNSGGSPADSIRFAAGKLVAEDSITTRLDETLGIFVIESGNYSRNGVRFEARVGENTVEGILNTNSGYAYQLNLNKPNHAVLSTAGLNGGDGGWPVLFGERLFRDNSMFLAFDEDQITDTDRYHTSEEIAYVAFEFVQALAVAEIETNAVTCHGDNNGSAAISITGGEAPYEYKWSNGANTATVDGLSAGSYIVTITDANGTELTATANVSQPPAINWNLQGGAVSCFGADDGYALVLSFGGTGQHAYAWTNGTNTNEISDLSPGDYTVYITDENGCLVSDTYEVIEPTALLVENSQLDVLCFGENSGSIQTTASGGTGQISYLWNTGATTPNLNNVEAGEYNLTATDGNGCETMTSVVVGQPPLLEVTTETTFTSCSGGNDGSATVSHSGGSGDVTYQWSTGSTDASIENLGIGSYSVTVTDANGCSTTTTAEVTDPAMLAVTIEIEETTCADQPNGSAQAVATGGTGDLTFEWGNGETNPSLENLDAGIYEVIVTDLNGCTASAVHEIHGNSLLEVSLEASAASCEEISNGQIQAFVSGGFGDISLQWSNGETSPVITDLTFGEYSLTVTDEKGCEISVTDTVDIFSILLLEDDIVDVKCFAGADGIIDITPLGGNPPYSFEWSDSVAGDQSAAWMLEAGSYFVTVTDIVGCTTIDTFTVEQPSEINLTIDTVTAAIGANADGAIDISVAGGTPNYTFQWYLNNDLISDEEDPSGLAAGTYVLVLKDENGCEVTDTIVVESVTSAEERNLLQHIRLTPNPTKGLFSLFLDLPNNNQVTASIFDISGKTVLADVPVENRYDFDLTNEAAGIYLLKINVGDLEITKRVVVVD